MEKQPRKLPEGKQTFKSMRKVIIYCLLMVSTNAFARYSYEIDKQELAVNNGIDFSVYDLTCESERCPIGIDNKQPCFGWKIFSERRGFTQSAYRILVADSRDMLEQDRGNVWDSRKVASGQSVLAPFGNFVTKGPGSPRTELKSSTVYYWKVMIWNAAGEASEWSEPQTFATGLFEASDWKTAKWIALEKDRPDERTVPGIHSPRKNEDSKPVGFYKLPQFRKVFTPKKPVKRATAYIAGLGHFDFFLNGQKVGNHFLDAGWTFYDKQALYVTFDITESLRQGDNVLGVMLGNGFYNTPFDRYLKLLISYGAPKMKMLLKLEYADGSTEDIVSDTTWKTTESPITFSSIYGGEDYDVRREWKGWTEAGFDDSAVAWQNALMTDYPGTLASQRSTPLTIHSEIQPIKIYKNSKGRWLYDLGQNFSGIIRVSVKSTNSQKITFRPAELLNPDSTTNQSATGSPFLFSYITADNEATATWQPQFTYYGFRYVEVEGAVPAGSHNPDGLPEILSLTGLHTCNSAAEAGSFICSKPLFNQIHNLIDWALRSNMASVLTDCPHREKLGWLEQAHLMQYSLLYRYDLSRMYSKIMNDMLLSQREDKCIPTIAPEYVRFENGFEDTPEWGSSFIISPWYIYKWYGDRRLLETYYPAMKRYLEYLTSRAEGHIIAYGLGDWFDIGPKNPGNAQLTSNGVSATAIYYYDTTIMYQIALLLGKKDDAEMFKSLAANIKDAFNNKFYDPATGKIERNSQAANAMALYMGLVDDANHDKILQNLIDDIRGRNNALTAGDIGYRYVLRVLEDNGRSDVIFDMNSKYDVPGYGWQLAHGATALTESWQAYGFVSNNHFMLGHLMEWLYSGLGGIRQKTGSVAFREIIIDPQIVGDVNFAKTSYESPYGTIRCEWSKSSDDSYRLKVAIPANTTAEIALPITDEQEISLYGEPLRLSKSVKILRKEGGKTWVSVGSGEFFFEIP
jgi:hypothetical protein